MAKQREYKLYISLPLFPLPARWGESMSNNNIATLQVVRLVFKNQDRI